MLTSISHSYSRLFDSLSYMRGIKHSMITNERHAQLLEVRTG